MASVIKGRPKMDKIRAIKGRLLDKGYFPIFDCISTIYFPVKYS